MDEVRQIYRIEIPGIDAVISKVQQLTSEINLQKAVKREAQQILLANPQDVAVIERQSKVIADSEIAVKKLTAEKKIASKEGDALIKRAQAEAEATQAAAGSYNELYGSFKKLNDLYRSTPKTDPLFEQIKVQAIEAKAKVDAFNRSLSPDGTLIGEYTTGIVNAFKRLNIGDILRDGLSSGKQELAQLEQKTNDLVVAYRRAQVEGTSDLNKLQKEIHDNVVETENYRKSVLTAEEQLRGMSGIGTQITSGIRESFKGLKSDILQMAVGYFGFQAAFTGAMEILHKNAELSDSIAQLKIYIHGTKDEAVGLVEALKKIDTRTSLGGLVDIATAVAQKGVARDNIAGVTQAFDELFTALGKGAGDTHEGVLQIAKLISIFNEDHEVTPKRVRELGNAMFALQSSGPVQGEFLQGFAERVGAVRSITGATIPQILGFAAAYQQLGQSEEVAGSATSILLTKMIANEDKFAAVAGKPIAVFKEIVKNNPFEALLEVAEKLRTKGGVEEIVKAVGDLGVNAVRTRGAFSELINNSELFREKMNLAAGSINDTSGELAAFTAKQNTFAASLDRIKKTFETAGANTGFMKVLSTIGSSLEFLVKLIFSIPFSFLVTGITVATAAWAYYKGNVISATIAQAANNDATLLGMLRKAAERLGLLANTEAKVANTIATEELAVAEGEAAVATEALNVATKASPLGLILGILALVVPAIAAFGASTSKTAKQTGQLSDNTVSAAHAFDDLNKKVNVLQNGIVPLAKRYDELKTKASLNKDEQAELKNIIGKVAEAIPGAITEFDQYGNALAINTKRVYEYVDAEKARLKVVNKNAIEQYQNDLRDLDKQIADKARIFDEIKATGTFKITEQITGGTGGTGTIDFSRNATKEQVAEAVKAYKELLEMRKGYNAEIDRLNGEALQKQADAVNAGVAPPPLGGKQGIKELRDQLKVVEDQIAELDQIKYKTADEIGKTKTLRAQKLELEKELKELGAKLTVPKYGGAALTGLQKDQQKELDAELDIYKAALERAFIQRSDFVKKFKTLAVTTGEDGTTRVAVSEGNKVKIVNEETYLHQLLSLNNEYLDKKIAALKGSNAEEDKLRAEWNLQKIKNEKETNQKLFDISNHRNESSLSSSNIAAQTTLDTTLDNFNLSNEDKVKAREAYYNTLLANQLRFNQQQLQLEALYGISSIENEQKRKEAIAKILKELHTLHLQEPAAEIQDIRDAAQRQIAEINANADRLRRAILENDKLTVDQKKAQLDRLEKGRNITVLAAELAELNIEVPKIKSLLDQNLVDVGVYVAALAAQQKKAADLAAAMQKDNKNAAFSPGIQGTISAVEAATNKKGLTDEEQALTKKNAATGLSWADFIVMGYDVAKQAMEAYFNAEAARINESKQNALDRAALEHKQQLAQAQSAAEKSSLDDQYAEKQKKIEQEAGARLKKVKKEEAKITLASELANIAAGAAANILNGVTFGAAGVIQYGLLAALAVARYAINLKNIDSATFGYGGNPDLTTTRGGRVKGRPHTEGGNPFVFKGRVFEDEVDELNIIRTKNASKNQRYSITGTHTQIASKLNELGGGVAFAPGADWMRKTFDFGGFLGEQVQAPVNPQSYLLNVNHSGGSDQMDKLMDAVGKAHDSIAKVSARIDKIQVVQVTRTVRDSIAKEVKNESIATL